MNIKTKEFKISEAELRYVNKTAYYKPMKDLIIGLASFIIIILVCSGFTSQAVYIAICPMILLGCLLIAPFLDNLEKSQYKLIFKNRSCEITESYFSIIFEDGSLTKMNFNNYVKVTREFDWYFLYITKTMFVYLPIRAFNSEDEINKFETAMKNKKLMA